MKNNVNKLPFYTRYADQKRFNFIKENLKNQLYSKGKILDVGCGNGIISMNLGKFGYTVHGIDVSEKAINIANETNPYKNVTFNTQDVESLIESNVRYQGIVCSEVIEHLNNPSALLGQLYKILDDNGKLIVTVPNGKGPRETFVTKPVQNLMAKDNWIWHLILRLKKLLGYTGTTIQSAADDLSHLHFFTIKQLRDLAYKNNFKIESFHSSNFIDDIFPFSLLSKRIYYLQKLDAKIADILPVKLSGGFMMIWKKIQ